MGDGLNKGLTRLSNAFPFEKPPRKLLPLFVLSAKGGLLLLFVSEYDRLLTAEKSISLVATFLPLGIDLPNASISYSSFYK